MTARSRRLTALVGAAALTGGVLAPAAASASAPLGAASPPPVVARETVAAMTAPIYRVTHPSGNTLLTAYRSEAENAVANLGWTSYEVAFYGSREQVSGSQGIYRLYNPESNSFLFTSSDRERGNAEALGFRYEGTSFYVPSWDMRGTDKVNRLHKVIGSQWRYLDVIGAEQTAAALADGWILDGQSYRAVAAPAGEGTDAVPTPGPEPTPVPTPAPTLPAAGDGDGEFTFVQFNDTQEDVFDDTLHRFSSRVDWILANEKSQDIRFAAHTGDVVNWWETRTNNAQYRLSEQVMAPLFASNIPAQLAVGNHDTLAVADGQGWANKDANGNSLASWGIRQTGLLNQHFPLSDFRNLEGVMEPGKLDNAYSTFTAENADFLVLSIEPWPRREALDWAKKVVADHPRHNVIVLTHVYLWPSGSVVGDKEYGDLPPTAISNELVKAYPNVKLVLSGHVGNTHHTVQQGAGGNQVLAVTTNMSPSNHGPLRLFDIDVTGDKVTTDIVRTKDGTRGWNTIETPIDWITR